jgi:hypothetical protein
MSADTERQRLHQQAAAMRQGLAEVEQRLADLESADDNGQG